MSLSVNAGRFIMYKKVFTNRKKDRSFSNSELYTFYLHEKFTERFNAIVQEKKLSNRMIGKKIDVIKKLDKLIEMNEKLKIKEMDEMVARVIKSKKYDIVEIYNVFDEFEISNKYNDEIIDEIYNFLENDRPICRYDSLNEYRSGKSFPTYKRLVILAKALDVTIKELGYPRNTAEAMSAMIPYFEDNSEDNYKAFDPEEDNIFFVDDKESCYLEIIKYFKEDYVDRCTAISIFPQTYLIIDDKSIEFILKYQKFNDSYKNHIERCLLVFFETDSLEPSSNDKSSLYKQVLFFLEHEKFEGNRTEKLYEAQYSLHNFIQKNSNTEAKRLLEWIEFYLSLDSDCFKKLNYFASLDNDLKRTMMLQIADQMYLSNDCQYDLS